MLAEREGIDLSRSTMRRYRSPRRPPSATPTGMGTAGGGAATTGNLPSSVGRRHWDGRALFRQQDLHVCSRTLVSPWPYRLAQRGEPSSSGAGVTPASSVGPWRSWTRLSWPTPHRRKAALVSDGSPDNHRAGDRVLGDFLPFNSRFGVPAAHRAWHRQLPPGVCLDAVLCFKYIRTVANDNTVRTAPPCTSACGCARRSRGPSDGRGGLRGAAQPAPIRSGPRRPARQRPWRANRLQAWGDSDGTERRAYRAPNPAPQPRPGLLPEETRSRPPMEETTDLISRQ